MDINKLIKYRGKNKMFDKYIERKLLNQGLCIPRSVKIGKNVYFPHNAIGTVIHPWAVIGDNVKIYQNVTLGRADIWVDSSKSEFKSIHIDDGAIICAGAKIICKKGILKVGKNTIIGANAVLTCSTGDNEVWAGIPAKRIK